MHATAYKPRGCDMARLLNGDQPMEAERSCEPESAARPKGADMARDREMTTNRYKSVQIGVQILEK